MDAIAPDSISRFAEHAATTAFEALPAPAVGAARTFILDTLGVGLVGSAGPHVDGLRAVQRGWGDGDAATVWGSGLRLPAPAAAMCNAYQTHNSEFDCIHEAAVVHPMSVVLPAALAVAERQGGVSGRDLLAAVVLGVDVACHLGVAARSGMKFFRPATAGAFGGTAAAGRLMGFDAGWLTNAFSLAYAQLCGTMQAHAEGSPVLALQVGFNARNAVSACDLATLDIAAPRQVLEGGFGYFRLFEDEVELAPVLGELGRVWRITEVAHKPWPSGRATHGIVEACLALQAHHDFAAAEVERITARVPPLTHRLVGRPARAGMSVNHARLSAPFAAARALLGRGLGVADFAPAALADRDSIALAHCIEVVEEPGHGPNDLAPVHVDLLLVDGRRFTETVETVYGSPAKPLGRDAHLAKFRGNCAAALPALPAGRADRLIEAVDGLEAL
ncbi:MAG TPA: MmgE/PrpD family protein, partial [Alphaproteobacteria bacterium]|nr:MmgE/PrpD family protein [Alphaproteobacteria bacterium]